MRRRADLVRRATEREGQPEADEHQPGEEVLRAHDDLQHGATSMAVEERWGGRRHPIAHGRYGGCHAGFLDDRLPELDLLLELSVCASGVAWSSGDRRRAELGELVDHVLVGERGLARR